MKRSFTRDKVKKCVAKLNNRQAARAYHIMYKLNKYGGEEMLTTVRFYNRIWKKTVRT